MCKSSVGARLHNQEQNFALKCVFNEVAQTSFSFQLLSAHQLGEFDLLKDYLL